MKLIPDLKQKIEAVISTTLDEYEITMDEWKQSVEKLTGLKKDQRGLIQEEGEHEGAHETYAASNMSYNESSLNLGERVFFKVKVNEQEKTVVCWGCAASSITMETRGLIELLIRSNEGTTGDTQSVHYESDIEKQLTELGMWVREQMELGEKYEPLPEQFTSITGIRDEKIIFLLQAETPDAHRVHSRDLSKLLESYFGEEVSLMPLGEQEWVFLGNKEIITDEAEEDTAEGRKDSLNAFCLGLYELVASEWAGVFHLSASLPCIPCEKLVPVAALLQESVQLGRSFHVTQHIHLSWDLHLERLVASISEQQRLRFIQETGKNTVIFDDSETLGTLETFFRMDCNVSETAKRLFIHRNTLVYRLDKIKQEIGYDVRNFESAIMVQLLLLMYKVTKKH